MGVFSTILGQVKSQEFLWGLLVATVVWLVVYGVLKLILRFRKTCNRITVQDEGGNFVIYRSAFFNFLTGVFEEVPGIELNDVKLTKMGEDQVRVNLLLKAEPEADVIKIHETLRKGILKEISDKLGITSQIGELNLLIKSLPPSDEMKGGES